MGRNLRFLRSMLQPLACIKDPVLHRYSCVAPELAVGGWLIGRDRFALLAPRGFSSSQLRIALISTPSRNPCAAVAWRKTSAMIRYPRSCGVVVRSFATLRTTCECYIG